MCCELEKCPIQQIVDRVAYRGLTYGIFVGSIFGFGLGVWVFGGI